MAFKNDITNWKSLNSGIYHMNTVPQEAYPELCGLIKKAAKNEAQLKRILDKMAEIIPCEPPQDWSWDFLVYDISDYVGNIKAKVEKGRFSVFIDCVSLLLSFNNLSIEDINEYLQDNDIGYRAKLNNDHCLQWIAIDENGVIEKMDEAQQVLPSISQQAYDEIRRAKKALEEPEDERAVKDALRGCVSAMEAVVKEFGNDNEIGNATKNLRAQGKWGPEDIVKEGNAIFNLMHRLYPDLRHGSTETSSLSLNEAEYWIGRILNFIQYMDKQQRLIKQMKSN